VRRAVFQLSNAGEGGAKYGRNVLPRVRRTDSDVVPRVRARFGVLTTQDARKDALIEINEVVQTDLGQQGEYMKR